MAFCEDCGGDLSPRSMPGLSYCVDCGKLAFGQKQEKPKPEAILPTEISVPDYSEVMIGWRAWGVRIGSGDKPVLQSVTHRGRDGRMPVWTPRQEMVAICHKAARHVPGEKCHCGIYSAKTLGHLNSMGYHRYDAEQNGCFHVIGSIKLWGKIVEGTQGWRAEKGYPQELYLPYEAWHLQAPLAEAYGVPVRLKNILRTQQEA